MTAFLLTLLAIGLGFGAGWVLRARMAIASADAEEPRAEAMGSAPFRDSLIAAIHGAADPAESKADDKRLMVDVLRMIADQHGATGASLWVAPEIGEGDGLQLVAWSRSPEPTLTDAQMGLVRWAAENDVLAFDRADGAVGFAAVRAGEAERPGALALLFEGGKSTATRDALRYWLPRHATRMAAMHDVLHSRAESARRNLRLRNAMKAAMQLQESNDPIKLEDTFVKAALDVTGADWAVLVRWDGTSELGEVRASTDSAIIPPDRMHVHRETLLGDTCADAAPVIYRDARAEVAAGRQLVDGVPLPSQTGSLVLVPMNRKRGEPAIGALACGHHRPWALTKHDASSARDLATVAAGALSVAWVVEDERASARRDGLTDLFNRRAFEEHFASAIDWTDRNDGTQLALVIVDIDFFKKVNDTYGHDAGDRVLQAVSRVLSRDRRATDTVARLGGEELALILPNVTPAGAKEVAEKLRGRIETLRVNTNAGEVQVTASFGVAVYRSRSADAGTLFERADQALYAAKKGGRNQVQVAR